jgi:hypothetical protein
MTRERAGRAGSARRDLSDPRTSATKVSQGGIGELGATTPGTLYRPVMKLAWCVVLVAVGGCKKAPPDPQPPPKETGPGSATRSGEPAVAAQPVGAPPLPGGGDRAFVVDAAGLVEVSDQGGSQVVVPGEVTWCNVDARGKVVWFTTKDGLRAFDLEDRRVRPIVTADFDDVAVIINWGTQQLGGEDKLAFHAGLELAMTGVPTLAPAVGCEGDAAHFCYEDGDESTPTSELAATLERVKAMKLADPKYVESIAKRGATGSLWTAPPAPPKAPKAPKISRQPCGEEPQDCGKLTAIPGSSLWLVTTANSRGDFYHETRELYDPATGELVAIEGDKLVRAKQPRAEGSDLAGMRISTSGTLSHGGVVFSPTKVIYKPKSDEAQSCGWSSGGWRMPSIRD